MDDALLRGKEPRVEAPRFAAGANPLAARPVNAVHFATAAEFRAWLAHHHATASELVIAFYKKSSGKSGLSYKEAVDEALCFGWIDGLIRRIDEERFSHRFTPRKR